MVLDTHGRRREVDPLPLFFAFLGAGGLGAILKIVLSASSRQQTSANEALTHSTDRIIDVLTDQGEQTRELMKEQARIVRDGHIKLSYLLQATGSGQAGKALQDVMQTIEERTDGR